ncbi:MAG: DUF4116 domain-containing protein, partial [Chlamydiia bacterium]|nr:DUF4116 domain-containing protein [Chlamydiia bacterium]
NLLDSTRKLNRHFVIEVLKANGSALQYLDKIFSEDRELLLIGVQKISKRSDLRNHQRFHSDREVMLNAIRSCADCMRLSRRLKADRAFVLEAVRLQPDSYHWVDEELKRDEEIVRTALIGNRFIQTKLPWEIQRMPWVQQLCSSLYQKEYSEYQGKVLMERTEELVDRLLTDIDSAFGINE